MFDVLTILKLELNMETGLANASLVFCVPFELLINTRVLHTFSIILNLSPSFSIMASVYTLHLHLRSAYSHLVPAFELASVRPFRPYVFFCFLITFSSLSSFRPILLVRNFVCIFTPSRGCIAAHCSSFVTMPPLTPLFVDKRLAYSCSSLDCHTPIRPPPRARDDRCVRSYLASEDYTSSSTDSFHIPCCNSRDSQAGNLLRTHTRGITNGFDGTLPVLL